MSGTQNRIMYQGCPKEPAVVGYEDRMKSDINSSQPEVKDVWYSMTQKTLKFTFNALIQQQ